MWMCVSLRIISAIALLFPLIYCEYNMVSLSINIFAKHRDNLSCAFYNYPTALKFSVYVSILWVVDDVVIVKWMVMVDAMNSSKFIETLSCNLTGNVHHHDNPSELYPPNPCLQASENKMIVGVVNVMLFISIL